MNPKVLPQQFGLEVLYEDNHIIVVNKPAGVLVQGDHTGDAPISDPIKAYLKVKYNKPGEVFLGTVHRLDRPVSGIVIFARTSKALTRLNKMFQDKTIDKRYWAIVEGHPNPTQARLEHHLVKNQKNNKSKALSKATPNSKRAVLSYQTKQKGERYTCVEVTLETGRHHQIRVQLSTNGNTIKGDLKYGAKRSNSDGSICLHAQRITFEHPVKKENMTITCMPNWQGEWKIFKSLQSKKEN